MGHVPTPAAMTEVLKIYGRVKDEGAVQHHMYLFKQVEALPSR